MDLYKREHKRLDTENEKDKKPEESTKKAEEPKKAKEKKEVEAKEKKKTAEKVKSPAPPDAKKWINCTTLYTSEFFIWLQSSHLF